MRRISNIIYTIAFFGCGLWALSEGVSTLFGGLTEISTTNTWATAVMVIISFTLRIFGEMELRYTKTLVFVGLTFLFGGVWGLGTILTILSGILMITRGFKHIKVLKEQTSWRELQQIRKERLAEVEEEEKVVTKPVESKPKQKVSQELLEGFVGSDDYKQEVHTWIETSEFEQEELTPEEIRARAKQEIRENALSIETLMHLDELKGETGQSNNQEQDLTNVNLDLVSSEESVEREGFDESYDEFEESYNESTLDDNYLDEKESDEQESDEQESDDIMGMTIEELLGE